MNFEKCRIADIKSLILLLVIPVGTEVEDNSTMILKLQIYYSTNANNAYS